MNKPVKEPVNEWMLILTREKAEKAEQDRLYNLERLEVLSQLDLIAERGVLPHNLAQLEDLICDKLGLTTDFNPDCTKKFAEKFMEMTNLGGCRQFATGIKRLITCLR